jgi:hypothetical protein
MRFSSRWFQQESLHWHAVPPVRLLQQPSQSQEGTNMLQLTEPVWQQMKQLTFWRSKFYGADFLH